MEILKVDKTEKEFNTSIYEEATLDDLYQISLSLLSKIIELYPNKTKNFTKDFFDMLISDYNNLNCVKGE